VATAPRINLIGVVMELERPGQSERAGSQARPLVFQRGLRLVVPVVSAALVVTSLLVSRLGRPGLVVVGGLHIVVGSLRSFGGLRLWGLVVGGRRRRDGLAWRGRLARDRRRGRLRRARGLDHSDYALAPHDRVGATRGRKRAQGDQAYDPRRKTRRRQAPRT